MTNLVERAVTIDDAEGLADLFNTVEVAAGGHPFATPAEQRSLITGWVGDVERNTRALVAPDGTIVAFAALVPPPPGGPRADAPGAVLPEWRGKGIGRSLMSWQLARAREAYAEAAPGIDWHLQTGALPGDESCIRLLERSGFRPVRYFFEMQAPAEPGHESTLPDGLVLRPYSPDLEDRLYHAHLEAFQDHWGYQRREKAQWQSMATRAESFRPDLSRVVLDGDRIVAYTVCNDGQPGDLYIGLVGTLRDYRRRGLASAMLGDVLAAAAAAGFATASLGVDADSLTGAVGVYEGVGFVEQYRMVAYQRALDGDQRALDGDRRALDGDQRE